MMKNRAANPRSAWFPTSWRGARALAVGLAIASASACDVDRKPPLTGDDGVTAPVSEARGGTAAQAPEAERTPVVAASMEARPADPKLDPDTTPEVNGDRVSEPVLATVTFGEAEAVFRGGDYAEAADLFEAYGHRRPDNPWGHYMLGISAWRAGDHPRAEAALRRTVTVDPAHRRGLVNLARVLLEQRKASDALDYAEIAVELHPESGEAWRVLGNAYSDLGMTEPAVEAYHEALALDADDAWTLNNLGLVLIRAGRYQEALEPLGRATELRPETAVFQNNMGIALERTGFPELAADAYRAALDADPEHRRARENLARLQADQP